MPEQERFARKQSRPKPPQRPQADAPPERSGSQGGGSSYEQELVNYLQERIRPGLNRGAIPLLARSIAKDIADGRSEQQLAGYLQERIKPGLNRGAIPMLARSIAKDLVADSTEGGAERHEEEEQEHGADETAIDFEEEMHDLQAELGDDWIVRFSVSSDDAWLTAEKTDGSQHVEAPTAGVLMRAAKLLNRRRGRSSD
jgi:hypothetical protein